MVDEDAENLLDTFDRARTRYDDAIDAVAAIGRENLETLAEAHQRIHRLLDTYEERATGTGDFSGYIAFREQVETLAEELPEDLPHRKSFETAADIVDKRRLSERDIESIKSAMEDVREVIKRLDEEEDARDTYRDSRRAVSRKIEEIEQRIDHIDYLLNLAEVDFDAPIGELRDPIFSYNAAVSESFDTYVHETPAENVLELFSLTDQYPLVPMPTPPPRLVTYLADLPEALTVPELLTYADYSQSKLAHFVDDPGDLKAAVATDRTYLERLSSTPFEIAWPPPEATDLRWQLRELISVVDRFAPEDVVTQLRSVREDTYSVEQFNRLREVAIARDTLDDRQRRRIQSGALAQDREDLATALEALKTNIEETEPP